MEELYKDWKNNEDGRSKQGLETRRSFDLDLNDFVERTFLVIATKPHKILLII